jgi:glutathione S-transferase
MPAATLVTVPFSHYCEKARWALDWTGVPYVEEGHVPGLHRIAVKRAGSRRTSVPVLVTSDRVLADSTDILEYLDATAPPEKKLYPTDTNGRGEAHALEEEFDERLGPHIRRVLYFHILPRRHLAWGLMDQRTPAWERASLRVIFPLLRAGMRRFMSIDARHAAQSRDEVLRVFDAVERRLQDGRPYLTGDRFTAADLTFAALASPSVLPLEHMIQFPAIELLPEPAATLVRETQARPVGAFLRRMYREHRLAGSATSA